MLLSWLNSNTSSCFMYIPIRFIEFTFRIVNILLTKTRKSEISFIILQLRFRYNAYDSLFVRSSMRRTKCLHIAQKKIDIFLFMGYIFYNLTTLTHTPCLQCSHDNRGIPPIDNEQWSSLSPGGKQKLSWNSQRIHIHTYHSHSIPGGFYLSHARFTKIS
jgi:hypothetical protein